MRKAVITIVIVVIGLGLIPARTAQAQKASISCPAVFLGSPLLRGPEANFFDDVKMGRAGCIYGPKKSEFSSASDDLGIEVRWAEAELGQAKENLCGKPKVVNETNTGSPPRSGSSIELPSPTHQIRAGITGDFLDEDGKSKRPAIEEFALGLMKELESGALPLPCQDGTPGKVTCTITVRDRSGRPVVGAHALLDVDGNRQEDATDFSGTAEFTGQTAGKEATPQVVLEDFEHTPAWFRIDFDDVSASAARAPFKIPKDGACESVISARGSPPDVVATIPPAERWPDTVEMYQRSRDAFRLGAQLAPLTYGLPVRIHSFCTKAEFKCTAGTSAAHAANGSVGSIGADYPEPFIAFGQPNSVVKDGNRPDNREYHEVGHWYLANLFGGHVPFDCPTPTGCNHKGYYLNRSSTDSWVEGFAAFYSAMVSKHIALRSYPELYRLAGAFTNIERDWLAWEADGRMEEFAIAGVLLDMEDGPRDYDAGQSQKAELVVDCCRVDANGVASGFVENKTPATRGGNARDVRVKVTLPDGTTKEVPSLPSDIPAGDAARVVVPATGAPQGATLTAVAREGRPGKGTDDDQVAVPLKTLMATIRGGPGTRGAAVFDVADLYAALHARFAGDRNTDGLDDVDEIFINHGLYDDASGDHRWETGDKVGGTARGAANGHTGLTTRRQSELPGAMRIPVTTGRDDAQVVVDIAFPKAQAARSTSYVAEPDADGRVGVDMPERDSGAKVTLVAVAPGADPVVAGTLSAGAFWTAVDKDPDTPAATLSAPLGASDGETGGANGGSSKPSLLWIVPLAAAAWFLRPRQAVVAGLLAGCAAGVLVSYVMADDGGGGGGAQVVTAPSGARLASAGFDPPPAAETEAPGAQERP